MEHNINNFSTLLELKNYIKETRNKILQLWDNDSFASNFKYYIQNKFDMLIDLRDIETIKQNIKNDKQIEKLFTFLQYFDFEEFIKNKKSSNLCIICALSKYIEYEDNCCIIYKYNICAEKILDEYYKRKYINSPYKTLVLDGGGILGYYQIKLLQKLQQQFNDKKDIGSIFDMICGTSTGSIIACGLASKDLIAQQLCDLYKNNAKNIFPDPVPLNKLTRIIWMLKHLFKSSANQTYLYHKLDEIFNNKTLLELSKEKNIKLCITSIDVNNNLPIIFKSYSNNSNYKVKDICLASSAAPIYFNNVKLDQTHYIDGGLWANNPIIIALSESLINSNKFQPIEIYRLSPPPIKNTDSTILDSTKQGLFFWQGGIKLLDTSIQTQSSAYMNIVNELSETLTEKFNKKINVYNFEHGQLSETQIKYFKLDNSDEDNFKLMNDLVNLSISNMSNTQMFNKIKKLFETE